MGGGERRWKEVVGGMTGRQCGKDATTLNIRDKSVDGKSKVYIRVKKVSIKQMIYSHIKEKLDRLIRR